jgi:hypothetical protein
MLRRVGISLNMEMGTKSTWRTNMLNTLVVLSRTPNTKSKPINIVIPYHITRSIEMLPHEGVRWHGVDQLSRNPVDKIERHEHHEEHHEADE